MPTGYYLHRIRGDRFTKRYPTPTSEACIEWLSYVEQTERKQIQHAHNGGEHKVGYIPVDGYCR